MPQALIEINAVVGSDDDLPINTLVQLSNADTGGEITYLWEILDQPEGAADALSSAAIENPTITPKKEGSYLIRLTINDSLASEASNLVVLGIRHLKTNERVPAAMETVEVSTSMGWKPATNRLLAIVDDVARDANLLIVVLPAAAVPTIGDIVRYSGTALIKAGLPGEERLLLVDKALATSATEIARPLGVVVGTPTGGAPTANGLAIIRRFGLVEVSEAGAPTIGDPVYVSDTAQPALAAGSNSRKLGVVAYSTAGTWYWYIDGSLAASWP